MDMNAQLDEMRRNGLSIDGENAYKRDLIDCIVGALAFGKQGTNQPPAGHWAELFWDMASAEGELQKQLLKERDQLRSEVEALREDRDSHQRVCIAEMEKITALKAELQRQHERHRTTFTQLEGAKREMEGVRGKLAQAKCEARHAIQQKDEAYAVVKTLRDGGQHE